MQIHVTETYYPGKSRIDYPWEPPVDKKFFDDMRLQIFASGGIQVRGISWPVNNSLIVTNSETGRQEEIMKTWRRNLGLFLGIKSCSKLNYQLKDREKAKIEIFTPNTHYRYNIKID